MHGHLGAEGGTLARGLVVVFGGKLFEVLACIQPA
jgi:hypothetical protein